MAITHVTPADAHRLMQQGHRYLDVRTEPEFAAGHPATAVNVPIFVRDAASGQMAPNPDFLAIVARHFPSDTPIVVGCMSGPRSQRAAEILTNNGYTSVSNMQGGFGGARDQSGRVVAVGWAESGLPICKDCGVENSYAGLRAGKPGE